MLKFYLVFMPNHQYHAEKRNRFRDTADFLFNNQIPNAKNSSCDSNVQDYFYTTVHEAERFLDEFFDYHSNGHGRREALMDHWRATGNRQITNETTSRARARSVALNLIVSLLLAKDASSIVTTTAAEYFKLASA